MSDIQEDVFDDVLPEDSISQLAKDTPSYAMSFASHFQPTPNRAPISDNIKVIDRCEVVVNTTEGLAALKPFTEKVLYIHNKG
jgi:hypothetical protein